MAGLELKPEIIDGTLRPFRKIFLDKNLVFRTLNMCTQFHYDRISSLGEVKSRKLAKVIA